MSLAYIPRLGAVNGITEMMLIIQARCYMGRRPRNSAEDGEEAQGMDGEAVAGDL